VPRLRTPSYRRAFLLAYAYRIGERLQETRRTAADAAAVQYGSSLELVLTAKTRHVDAAFEEAFPNARAMPGRRLNAEGYHAGRAAADRAQIAHGQELPRG